jgi:hypothetical protein
MQGPIGEAFQRANHEACHKVLMEFITGEGLPLSVVRSQRFKK